MKLLACMMRNRLRNLGLGLLAGALMLGGCAAAPPSQHVLSTFTTGQLGQARVAVSRNMTQDPSDRNYMLDRMRLGILTLADGYPQAAEPILDEVYDVLRTAGVNQDKTVASVVLHDGIRIWKGEPFEQALAYCYVGAQYASIGSWDNLRAATSNALFHLRDFGQQRDGEPISNETIVRRAAEHPDDRYLRQYQTVESDFTLAYLLNGLANQQMGRLDDAEEQYAKAAATNPAIEPLIQTLRLGQYNTLLLVDYGRGPQKIGTGPDQAIAQFAVRTPSNSNQLIVEVANQPMARYPVVTDVNAMARNHRWNNLEDMRIAKSVVGDVLIGAGAATALIGADQRSDAAVLAGLGMLLAGTASKASAHADTRYCEAIPQRFYLAAVQVDYPKEQVVLKIEGLPGSRLVLTNLAPQPAAAAGSASQPVQFRYVRLPSTASPANWAVSGQVYYSNRYTTASQGLMLPYVLGGHCVRPPSYEVLGQYQAAGYLKGWTLENLYELYRAEGISWDDDDAAGFPGVHVLEGGTSLATPLPGTAGYARLFGQIHQRYEPRSSQVRRLMLEHAHEIVATHTRDKL